MEILATRIRQLREALGTPGKPLALEKFARLVDTSTKSVSTWEKNQGDPELKSLVKIALACEVSTDYLLGLTDGETPASAAGSDPGAGGGAIQEVAAKASARASRGAGRKPRR